MNYVYYFGLVYARANQYGGDIASGTDSFYRQFDDENDYWDRIPQHNRAWRGHKLYKVVLDEDKNFASLSNTKTGETVTDKTKVPLGILDYLKIKIRS